MSPPRLAMVWRRLRTAVERHGLLTVIRVILTALVQNGLIATLRIGGAERPFPWKSRGRKAQSQAEAAMDARRRRDADLDDAYSLEPAAWDRWLPVLARPGEGPAARLLFVVRGARDQDGTVDRTRGAITAAGFEVWSESTPPDREAFHVFIEAGDEPSPAMAAAIGQAARTGICDVVSFDLWREHEGRVQPLFLPGANPTLLEAADYLFSRVALRGEALGQGGDLTAADPRALVLDWRTGRPAHEVRGRWRHAPQALLKAAVGAEAIQAERRRALNRRPSASPRCGPVTAVICTKDKGHLTRQLVHNLLAQPPELLDEVVVVSNNTGNPYALQTLADIGASPRVTVIRIDQPFNFSKLCNAGARAGRGRGPLLFLNDDIAPVSGDWLARLMMRLDEPDVGSVGPLLLYPDERVQHAGMYLGYRGAAGHVLRGAVLPDDDYLFTGCAPREVSAVTGAVLLTPRGDFEALGGFDEQLPTFLQDVDYCLRLKAIGRINVFDPAAILIHMESTSIRQLDMGGDLQRMRQAERTRFLARWGEAAARDPLHPSGFDIEDETLRRLAGHGGARPKGKNAG